MKTQTIEALKEFTKATGNLAALMLAHNGDDGDGIERRLNAAAVAATAALEQEQPEAQPTSTGIHLNTFSTIYLVTDGPNGCVKLLLPKGVKLDVTHLDIGDPNPETNASAEYKLLAEEMNEQSFDF